MRFMSKHKDIWLVISSTISYDQLLFLALFWDGPSKVAALNVALGKGIKDLFYYVE